MPCLTGRLLSPDRRQHLAAISQDTLTVVPERHGVQPNAPHCVLHLLTPAGFVEALLLGR